MGKKKKDWEWLAKENEIFEEIIELDEPKLVKAIKVIQEGTRSIKFRLIEVDGNKEKGE